jgi:homoserine O-acetyltransferase/O-succinyltransferase
VEKTFILFLGLLSFSAMALDELVKKQEFKLDSYETVSGQIIKNVRIGFETYGKLNAEKSNAILIAHYFTGNSHAAGKYSETDKMPGYWDIIIGPGKALDTNKYFIISSDTLANLTPFDPNTITTGPASKNPETKKPYGMKFPLVGVSDFVKIQKNLIDSLGIKKLHAVAGASGGAAQAVEWSALYPDHVSKVVAVIGPGLSLPSYTIALLNLWSAPILLDPEWNKGNYYGKTQPLRGLTESLKHITHSSVSFDWALQNGAGFENKDKSPLADYNNKYAIESLLHARGEGRAGMIDANSLLYMAKAIQSFNVEERLNAIKASVLFVPVKTDLIFPPELSVSAAKKLCAVGKSARVKVLETNGGHLDGLFKITEASRDIADFLNSEKIDCTH